MTTETPLISVIVPVKSGYTQVTPTLDALSRQDIAEPHEIIVSAEMNSPAARAAEKRIPAVKLALGKSDRGPGGNRNRGIEAASGAYLAFIDADVVPASDWLRRMLRALRCSSGLPVCGWTEVAPGSSRLHRVAHITACGCGRPRHPRKVPGVNGASMGISKSLLDRYGARFADRVYGAEEIFLLAALPPEKRMVLLDPRIRASEPRAGGLSASLQRMFRLGFGSGRLRESRCMRGALFARHLCLVPLMVPARFFQIACRMAYCRPSDKLLFTLMSPVVLLCLSWYAAGFAGGVRHQRRLGPASH